MNIRAFVLSKSHVTHRTLKGDAPHFNINRNAYTYDIASAYRDRDGKRIPIAIYHSNLVVPYPLEATEEMMDGLCAFTELAKMNKGKLLSGFNKKNIIILVCAMTFAFLYIGASL